jgi:uncharacterized protein YfbU (UPF0304 family)
VIVGGVGVAVLGALVAHHDGCGAKRTANRAIRCVCVTVP